jgi:hypothetical protein
VAETWETRRGEVERAVAAVSEMYAAAKPKKGDGRSKMEDAAAQLNG